MKMNLQKFAGKTNVFPVLDNKFKLGAAKESATTVADLETFSVSFSNGVETWTPMDTEGWQRALMTAKAVTITLSGKRNIGDTGNDFVAGKAYKNGHDAEAYFEWEFPDGILFHGKMLLLISRTTVAATPQTLQVLNLM